MASESGNSSVAPARGTLFVVATPIGNLGDLTPRAAEVLRRAELVLAEDTRRTAQLLAACAIERPRGSLESLHEHNERERVPRIIERLLDGAEIALVSDAGTPLLSDPGLVLVSAAAQAGVEVVAVPGPSALVAALSVAGLPTDRFVFEGFLPSRAAARRQRLEELAAESRTLVFYEAPHRVRETLEDLRERFGADRPAVVARELTKKFESVYRGSLGELAARAAADPALSRGEIVLLVGGADQAARAQSGVNAEQLLRLLLAELPPSAAAKLAAQITGLPRKELYERALASRG
ncbi:MAG TPA: 16S rRNA (cytidine(1402)-2'-O)-methyltransferase [Steroidobacteraceae bacterium]|nr:16S rRNA (cytidine(1402)-2'-O)-methyltransferase [Steroidobacteraceae bacterium]